MKKVNLVFNTAVGSDYTVSLADPKDDLALSECQAAGDKLVPILTNNAGVELASFKKAVLVTTTEEELA